MLSAMKLLKKISIIVVLGYLLLWLVTATLGIHHFEGILDDNIERIETKPKNIKDLENIHVDAEGYWQYLKCRAVAPFVIHYEFAFISSSIAGGAGKGVVFWFFGYKKSLHMERYWVI
jgi:hypothetical protein